MDRLRLVIFDVDGTLIDSQRFILGAMRRAFAQAGLPAPADAATLGIVGLSLREAMAALVPEVPAPERERLAALYKQCFTAQRAETGGEAQAPLYPGARAALERLDRAGWLLSVATGKGRRGLRHVLESHGLDRFFIGTQTADDAPSKPHPGMLLNCLAATGVEAAQAVMVGDSTFDMAMARAAGVRALGVTWGFQPPGRLVEAGAERLVQSYDALDAALAEVLEGA
ncbi:MAG TPA: HAD-IA family hydrolase [Thermohalobaculum sp.]|nr:HAD-IA family hydrolase [Thermohalobaculum sp.]